MFLICISIVVSNVELLCAYWPFVYLLGDVSLQVRWWFSCGGLVAKSCPTLVTPWTVAFQALLSIGFFRQEYWSQLPFLFRRDLPDPGIKPGSPALQADSLPTKLRG